MLETRKVVLTSKVKLKQMVTIDNQPQKREDDLKWLGGIIDGEGSVTATIGHTKTSKGHIAKNRRYTPLISIVNTDPLLVQEIERIFKSFEIPYYVYSRVSKKNPTWKRKWEFMINGMKRCRRAIDILEPYIRGEKKLRMQALREWIDYRLTVASKDPYTDKDEELLSLVRQSSVMVRDRTPNSTIKVDEDTVQAAA